MSKADKINELLEAAKGVVRTHEGLPYTSGDRVNARKRLAEAIKAVESQKAAA